MRSRVGVAVVGRAAVVLILSNQYLLVRTIRLLPAVRVAERSVGVRLQGLAAGSCLRSHPRRPSAADEALVD